MQITLTIPDADAPAVRDEYRRRLANEFPQVRLEEPGPRDANDKPTTRVWHEDDPDVDPIQLWLDDWMEGEVIAARMTTATKVKDASSDDDERKDALLAIDDCQREKMAAAKRRQLRGAKQ